MASANIESIVEYFGPQEDRHCGYCKSDDSNRFTHGMWAHKLSVQAYQDMLDRGWRRSGKYCYKPNLERTCCPQYTIRCDSTQFHASRSQKRVIRRLNVFLAKGVMPKRSHYDDDVDHPKTNKKAEGKSETIGQKTGGSCQEMSLRPKDEQRRQGKAKFKRRQRKLEKLRAQGAKIDELPRRPPPPPKSLETSLSFEPSSSFQCMKIKGNAHTLEIRLVRSDPPSKEFTDSFKKSSEIYLKYQNAVHNDPTTESGFRRFLVDSPLKLQLEDSPVQCGNDVHPGYGSFHQQYWLDNEKLIAVGVLDILPNSVSSKYFYYDPEFRPLALGVYSALQEIAFVRRLQEYAPNLKYYYMGYYIHLCPKMRYKARYQSSELLCPETYTWHPIEKCQTKLDANSYSRFDETGAADSEAQVEIDTVPVLFSGTLMPYRFYKMMKYKKKSKTETDEDEVGQYARLMGKKAVSNVMLYRSSDD